MSLPAGKLPTYSYEEYVRFEDANPARHEFVGGHILAMAGGTPAHARLQAAVLFALERRLEGQPCQPFPSDLRIRIAATGMATYPDVTVVCGPVQAAPEDPHAAMNPAIIVEVLSDHTSSYDRGEKFEHYRKIPTLQHYVLVSHRERRVEIRQREADGSWSDHHAGRGENFSLGSIGLDLTVDEIYDRSPLTSSL
jgi:Uma2 family endonuclease